MLALFALALGLRLAYVLDATKSPFTAILTVDPKAYHDRATRIAAGQGPGEGVFYQDPLYPYVVAATYRAIGKDDPRAVALAQAALDACTVILVLALASWAFGRAAGGVAGVLAAVYRPLWYYDALLLKTALSVFLVTAALVAFVAAARAVAGGRSARATRLWWLGGMAFGLACLTRGNYLLAAPALLGWVAWASPGLRARSVLVAALGAAMPIAPVTARNLLVGGDLVLITSQAGANVYIGNNPDNSTGIYRPPPFVRPTPDHEAEDFRAEAERRAGRQLAPSEVSSFWLREAIAYARRQPAHFLRHLGRKVTLLVNADEVPDNDSFAFFAARESAMLRWPLPGWGTIVPLAALGLAAAWRRRRDPAAVLIVLYGATYAGSLVATFVFSRYRMPLVPVALALAGAGVIELARLVRARRLAALMAALALVAGCSWASTRTLYRDEPAVYLYNLGYELIRLARAADEDRDPGYARSFIGHELAPQARASRMRALALAALDEAWALRPHDEAMRRERALAHSDAARAAGMIGDAARALAHADVAVALVPGDPIAHTLRALALRDLGRAGEAEAALARARALAAAASGDEPAPPAPGPP